MDPMSISTSSASWKSGDGVSDQFPAGLRVLVVDDDPTCLRILEKMLRNCLYEVMSADDSKNVVMKGVTHGACDYLIKPVRMEALKNIWQHVVRKKKHEWKDKDYEQSGSVEDGERQQKPSEDVDYSSSANEGNWKSSKKRKDEEDEGDERDDTSTLKKPRVVWSVELHQQFKYRLYLKRLSGQHHNGLGNSFMGPTDSTFGPMSSLNGLELQALTSTGQLPPQSLATIQAAALGRVTNNKSTVSVPLVDQRNIFSFESPKIRFVEGQQQHNNNKQVNLLHGIPTNMDSKQLAALHQSAQSFGNINMPIHSQSTQSNSVMGQMVQPQSRAQILNEINGSHALNIPSSVGQPVFSQAIPSAVLGRNGIDNVRVQTHASVSQPSALVDFSRSQRAEFPGNNTFSKGSGGFIPNYDVFSALNQNRTDDWGLQSVGSAFDAPQHSNLQGRLDVAPSVLVQPGFSSDQRSGHVRTPSGNKVAFSAADGLGNNTNLGQQIKAEDMGFQNGLFPDQFGQDDLMSALLKPQQEGLVPVESDFGFDGYHLDNLPV
ncbi:hypothetical protein DH2020_043657 [Rehmannia glutinosa]|uniref:Response regulatory domain-containing protein n=1 Tax=Rehmannia glutinosa TaxID=99300 RepID=A0ABR0UJ36_REHGL